MLKKMCHTDLLWTDPSFVEHMHIISNTDKITFNKTYN